MQSGFLHYSFHPGLEITRGQVRRLSVEQVEGINSFVTNGSTELVGNPANALPATIAEVMNIYSDDATDTIAGVGAQKVLVEGIDDSGDMVEETVEMNGVTDVPTVNSYYMINRMTVTQAGSTGSQAGQIKAKGVTASLDDARIFLDSNVGNLFIGYNESKMARFKLPDTHRGYVTEWTVGFLGAGSNVQAVGDVTFGLWDYDPSTEIYKLRKTALLGFRGNGFSTVPLSVPIIFEPGHVALVVAKCSSGTGTGVQTSFPLILETI